jgi:hypothetical protein
MGSWTRAGRQQSLRRVELVQRASLKRTLLNRRLLPSSRIVADCEVGRETVVK